jgi:hypothetical protein
VGNKTKYHIKKRCFLNRDFDMTAFVVGIVEDTRDIPIENEESWKWGTIELMLADCNRKVCFSFNMNNHEARADSLYKIRRIAEVVNGVKDALEIEAKSISKRKPPKKKTENNG